jgi:TolB protein
VNLFTNNKIFISWLWVTIIILLPACQATIASNTISPTPTPEIAVTQEPIHWATIAPASTHTPTPMPLPLRYIPVGKIAFESDRDGNQEIYLVNADGTNLSRLTNNPSADVFPAWSPNGAQLVFSSDRNGNPNIYIVNTDGSGLRQITKGKFQDALPTWSPDGKQIAFVSNRSGSDEIYVMNVDGSEVTQLSHDSGLDAFPSWSPDGTRIAYTSNRDVNFEIYMMDKDGKNVIRLTDNPASDSNPSWSPDGNQIAFISNRDGYSNLFKMDIDGKNVIQITKQRANIEKPSWSPDGRLIAFTSDLEGHREIYITGADGEGLFKLTNSATEDFYPSWSPSYEKLVNVIPVPTLAAQFKCQPAQDPNYGYSVTNPIKLGYDPRGAGLDETGHQCVPWLVGPQGQVLQTELLEQVHVGNTLLCKVQVTFVSQLQPVILYFDLFNYALPQAPQGFRCGSEKDFTRAVAAGMKNK